MGAASRLQSGLRSSQVHVAGLQAQKQDIESAIKAMEDPGVKSRLIGLVAGIATAGRHGKSWCRYLSTFQNINGS
jgi:hypothetical protein